LPAEFLGVSEMLKKSGQFKGTSGFPPENPAVPFFIYIEKKETLF
jgi:hypothetical protein